MNPHKSVLRMCVACREMKDKSELIRVVKNKEGAVFVDISGKAQGRGASICKCKECMDKCKKQKSLNKAFKCDVPPLVYEELLSAFTSLAATKENNTL